jgi:hypothetical protein
VLQRPKIRLRGQKKVEYDILNITGKAVTEKNYQNRYSDKVRG